MKIYKCMEPQPELMWDERLSDGDWVCTLKNGGYEGEVYHEPPHKIGEEIEYPCDNPDHGILKIFAESKHKSPSESQCPACGWDGVLKGRVKSIHPVKRGGFWCWEIEC